MGSRALLVAVLLLAILVVTLFWRLRPGRPDEPVAASPPAQPSGETPAPVAQPAPPLPGRVSARSGAKEPAREAPPAPPAVDPASRGARLRELLASESDDHWAWELALGDLVDERSPEAIGLVLEAMQDPRCDVAHRAKLFAELLEPVDDPRIAPAARAVLDSNIESGRTSWYDTWGYIELAGKGGPETGDYFSALLARGGQLATGAAQNVWRLADKTSPEPFLAALTDPANEVTCRDLADSLARWDDPAVHASLVELASSPEASPVVRTEVLKALASRSGIDDVANFGRWYWSASDDAGRARALEALGYLGYASKVEDAALSPVGVPLLVDALGDPSRDVWVAAVHTIHGHQRFHVAVVQEALAARLATTEDEADRELIEGALTKTRRTVARTARAANR